MSEINNPREPIEARIKRLAVDSGYPFHLLMVLYQSIPRSDTPILKLGGNPREQLTNIVKYISLNHDPRDWSINSFEDVSNAVRVLIDGGIVECVPGFLDDLPSQSEFKRALKHQNLIEKVGFYEFLKQPVKFQWTLGSMLLLLTTLSIAIAGYVNSGNGGVVTALIGAWLMLVGVGCIWLGLASKSPTKRFEIVAGFVVLAVGLAIFSLAVYT